MYIVAHTSVARDEEGRPLSLVSHIEDITERHHTDEALREALQRQNEMLDRLMELDQMKSDFVATVSHDLRTPLTSIVGYVEMLLDGDVGEISDRQHHILETVQHGAAQLQRRIDDLLTFARIEAGTYEPERLELELGAVVGEALKTVQGQASHKGVDLHVDRAGDVRVVGDSHQLEQLVLNLAGNAVKFTPAGGHVDVVVRRDRSQAVLDVTDTGIGISPEDQPLVFERFFRSSDVRERQIQGTGLGLAIVRSIVDAHRGSISLESTVGEGTTFSVRLPA
jgi:signal transduction histidine kinase